MLLTDLLDSKLIFLDDSLSSQEKIFQFLAHKLVSVYTNKLPSEEKLLSLAFERENMETTVFESGIAIPHVRLEGFNDILIALYIPKKPLLSSIAPQGVRLYVFIVADKTKAQPYLNVLRTFARISQDKAIFEELLSSQDSKEFLARLYKLPKDKLTIKKDITVSDIMFVPRYTVYPETLLTEIDDLFFKYQIAYLPVIDREGNFLGEITLGDVIEFGLPNYVKKMSDVRFVSSLESFERFLEQERHYQAYQIMKKPPVTLVEEDFILFAVSIFYLHKTRYIPVLDAQGKLVGVMNHRGFLNKILRA